MADGSEKNFSTALFFPFESTNKEKRQFCDTSQNKNNIFKRNSTTQTFIIHIILFSEKKMCGNYRKALLAVYLITVGHIFAIYYRVFFLPVFPARDACFQ